MHPDPMLKARSRVDGRGDDNVSGDGVPSGGGRGIRTPDLYSAIVALSQLSYAPASLLLLMYAAFPQRVPATQKSIRCETGYCQRVRRFMLHPSVRCSTLVLDHVTGVGPIAVPLVGTIKCPYEDCLHAHRTYTSIEQSVVYSAQYDPLKGASETLPCI